MKEKADFKMSLKLQTMAVRSRELGMGGVPEGADDFDFDIGK